ncbi:MAG: hypothetical protein H0X37_15415 [Herpetosiphonaceae bacterium]|nr:hypothetical protein [Herpetosiphonaceae bacterium]
MMRREPSIEDADAEVPPARDEEADHNLSDPEVVPASWADEHSHSPFMEIEEETLPPDFPRMF